MSKKSLIWTKFSIQQDLNKPYCNRCKLVIIIKGSSTRNLWCHLENYHFYDFQELKKIGNKNIELTVTNTKVNLEKFINNNDIRKLNHEIDLIKLICTDGFSLNSIINSTTLKKLYQNFYNKSIPLSNQTLKNIVIKNSNYFKNKLNIEISDLIKLGIKFCLYIDEWKDNTNNYFLNLIISNENQIINLGLINVTFL